MNSEIVLNSVFKEINFLELKVFLKDKEYEYFLIALKHLINEIKTFTLLPPSYKEKYNKKNLNNMMKENFLKLKETFNKICYILLRLEFGFKTKYSYPLQYPLIIRDEIELNIIDKLLNDSLNGYDIFKGLININKLGNSLKHCFDLGKIDF